VDDRSKPAETKDPRIEAAIRDYLERVDRGEAVNREEFISRHAEIADALRSFFGAEEPLRKMAATKISSESAGISTQSFAAQGQETVPPKSQPDGSPGTTGSGLQGKFGRYQIIRALGKGAMGAVYLAEDSQLERKVAIKTPHFEDDPTGELIARFYREARAAATLRHANICPVHDVGQIDGKHFISMAYIEGRPLSDVIRGGKAQSERPILIAVQKLARALQEAHDHQIVHRDLKPANIMVDKKGEPIIMDFGLARKARKEGEATLTQSGAILGSPAYMSPEQIEGDPESVGPASDQYNLGVVLYEMLTGQLPFRGSMVNVLAQIITKGPVPPSELRAGLDPRIEAVCLRMMSKKASDRFPSMKAVAEELAVIVKNPAATPAAPETSPTPNRPPVPTPTGDDARASQIRKPVKEKTLTESDMTSLEELVRKCTRRRDYDQMIQIIERIPENRRSEALQSLLEKAREKLDEISFLICEIDEADRLNDARTALKKAEELLKIKPRHHRAIEIQEKYSGYGDGGAARIGLASQFTRPWSEGGWIPWSVLAFGLAVFGVMTGVIVIYLGRTAVVIDIQDPGVEVAVKGTTLTVTGPDKQSVQVEPGEQALKITHAGLETITKSFTLKKGDKKAVTVSIVDKEIVARLENEILPLVRAGEEKASSPTASGKTPLLPLAPAHEKQTTATLPPTLKNSLGMEFVLVPKGKSWLGGGEGRPGDKEVVITRDFYLGKYEVTQEDWEKVTGLTPSWYSRTGGGRDKVKDIADGELKRFPVEEVSWDDVQLFLEALNKREKEAGWLYRLPKEVEWEFACRGGPNSNKFESAYDFYLDKPTNQLSPDQANFAPALGKGLQRTCKVGSYKPNRLGLYDMHGNVTEWCDDAEKTAEEVSRRLIRGGSWFYTTWDCRSALQKWVAPAIRYDSLGLRVARVHVGNESVAASLPEQTKTETPAPTASNDPDRRAAEWVLSIGGRIGIEVDRKERDIAAPDRVPPQAFQLRTVRLPDNPKVSDAGLACASGCRNLKALDLYVTKVSDAGLAYFKDCKDLDYLSLGGTQVTDAGLANFKHCENLAFLGLRDTQVTDAGLANFKHWKNLGHLELSGTRVSDAGLACFKDCKNLWRLDLGDTQVTDPGLALFKDWKKVYWLGLNGTQVTDTGLAYLKDCKNLGVLGLGGTNVSDAGVVHLKRCRNLTELDLTDIKVTDATLERLADFRKLVSLVVKATNVTEKGVKKFAAARPRCKIEWDGGLIAPLGHGPRS
jgi:serine/threonine protein kinase/formylglycine-generating enzyme required for sulfatase activity